MSEHNFKIGDEVWVKGKVMQGGGREYQIKFDEALCLWLNAESIHPVVEPDGPGPVERVLTELIPCEWNDDCNRLASIRSYLIGDEVRRKYIDAAIAAERSSPKDDCEYFKQRVAELTDENERMENENRIVKQERDRAIGSVDALKNFLNQPDVDRPCSEGHPVGSAIRHMETLERKVAKLQKTIPHDYDLLKQQVALWDQDYASLSAECAEAKRERDEAVKQRDEAARNQQPASDVPREAIAWVIGWLNCELALSEECGPTQELNDRVEVLDAWLKGGA